MWLQTAACESRLRQVAALWLAVIVAGLAWVLWTGNRRGLEMIVHAFWIQDHRDLVRMLWDSNYFLLPFYAVFVALLIHAWVRHSRQSVAVVASYLLAQLIGTGIAVRLLKVLTGEARPRTLRGTGLDSQWIGPTLDNAYHSFPSGHAADAFISAIFIAVLLPRPWMRAAVIAYATINALSRIAVSRHYPADVISGAFLGGLVAVFTAKFVLLPWLRGTEEGLSGHPRDI
jgi:membrane-associated phospholipid phosphatase